MNFKKLLSTPHLPKNLNSQFNPPFEPQKISILATNLIKSYFETGNTDNARILFDEMPEKDLVSWTAMIAGYTSCNHHPQAWAIFRDMMRESNDNPNEFTLSSALKACKGMNSLISGSSIHGLALKLHMDGCVYVDNALLDMYATCCVSMNEACLVFNDIREKNAVSWTTLITGYTHRGDGYGGLQAFRQMLLDGAKPNAYSFSIAIRACASIGSLAYGRQVHLSVIKHGFELNTPVMNSILDMYCRCSGSLLEANRCFYGMIERDLITWNTFISGYEKSNPDESLHIFSKMESDNFTPNCFTFTSVIAACANLAALSFGQQVHGGIIRRGLNRNLALANALIDMYAKCGNIVDSHKVFDEMPVKNLVSWTTMMIGYGSHGYGEEAIDLFDEMVKARIRPDRVVFMAVLSACSHAGLVDKGLSYFKSMVCDYGLNPDQDIYCCIVDLLGRAGRVEKAYEIIKGMPFQANESVWGAFLGACKAHKIWIFGKLAVKNLLDLRPNMAGTYMILSNIYAAEGKWGEFAKMRKLMRKTGNRKEAGRSWVEVRNRVYSFVVGDKIVNMVYGVIEMLIPHMKEAGYVPDLECLPQDMDDEI